MPELGTISLISAAVLIALLITLYGVQSLLVVVAHRRAQREQEAQIEAYLRDADRPYDWSVDGI